MIYRLIILSGPLINQRISVEPRPMVIGRDPSCDISVPDTEVALRHAQIEHRLDGLYIRDLGSMNKILVNQREVREAKLKHGDIFELGRTRFLVQALVQADVADTSHRSKRLLRVFVCGVIFVCVAVGAWRLLGGRRTAPAIAHETNSPSTGIVVTAALPQSMATAPEPATGGGEVASEELRRVQEDLAAIRDAMRAIAERTTTGIATAAPSKTVIEDLKQKAADLVSRAVAAISEDRLEQAEQLLAAAISLDPELWQAYEQKAKLLERKGLYESAIREWAALVDRNPPPDIFERAVGERMRLARALRSGELRVLRVVQSEQTKMPTDSRYDEIRLVRVGVVQDLPDRLLDPALIKVVAEFYEERTQGEKTGVVACGSSVMALQEAWNRSGTNWFETTYQRARGDVSKGSFYGFKVSLYYNDRLSDQVAKPQHLAWSSSE